MLRCIKTPRCSQIWGEWVERYQSRQKRCFDFWYRPDDYVYVHIYKSKKCLPFIFITGKENALVEAVVEPSMSLPTQVVKKLILWIARLTGCSEMNFSPFVTCTYIEYDLCTRFMHKIYLVFPWMKIERKNSFLSSFKQLDSF